MKTLVLIGSAVTILMSMRYNEEQGIARFEFPVLVLLATTGMMMMISANDLITLYVGLELQSLALYVVASFDRDSPRSSEAGLKYFVLGALSSGMLLYGASLVYGFAGTTSFRRSRPAAGRRRAGLARADHRPRLHHRRARLQDLGGAVPHVDARRLRGRADPGHARFSRSRPRFAALALFIRLMIGPFGPLIGEWRQIIVFLSVASMILGSVAAIAQRNIKRLMAYSSIGHVGYALIGLAAGTAAGIRGVLVYLAIYLFMNVGAWAVILCMRRKGQMLEEIADLAGLSRTRPALALALGDLHVLAGRHPADRRAFSPSSTSSSRRSTRKLTGLAVIGVVTSVVGAFYYLRIVKVMYFDEPTRAFDAPIAGELKGVLLVTALVTLFFFLLPGPLVGGAEAAAASLFLR